MSVGGGFPKCPPILYTFENVLKLNFFAFRRPPLDFSSIITMGVCRIRFQNATHCRLGKTEENSGCAICPRYNYHSGTPKTDCEKIVLPPFCILLYNDNNYAFTEQWRLNEKFMYIYIRLRRFCCAIPEVMKSYCLNNILFSITINRARTANCVFSPLPDLSAFFFFYFFLYS